MIINHDIVNQFENVNELRNIIQILLRYIDVTKNVEKAAYHNALEEIRQLKSETEQQLSTTEIAWFNFGDLESWQRYCREHNGAGVEETS